MTVIRWGVMMKLRSGYNKARGDLWERAKRV